VAKKHLEAAILIGYNLIETPDGGYILAGSSHSNISGKKVKIQEAWEIFWVLKSTIQETIVWQKLREQW
jgi:hypothetical protein